MMRFELDVLPRNLLVGTSSWACSDWKGSFYPDKVSSRNFISEYVRLLPTVEVDTSFYRPPSIAVVEEWSRKTPAGFIFSAKMPHVITHEKGLVGCEEETRRFLTAMSRLGPRLGPLVLQFAYVSKEKDEKEAKTGADFKRRLAAYLSLLPKDFRYAVEIRNKTWIDEAFLKLLTDSGVALVLSDHAAMPGITEILKKFNPLTASFAYVRFLGERKTVEDLIARKKKMRMTDRVKEFDELLIDRTEDMRGWIPGLKTLCERASRVYVYFNNHYAGFGPGSVALFTQLWRESVVPAKSAG